MLYSSGTTGQPKGILRPLPEQYPDDPHMFEGMLRGLYGFDEHSVYLSPAPLYHSAPLGFCLGVQRLGGTVVVMERFDAETALALIERHRVTHSQWVPTMFSRMLKLPDAVRARYDLSSLKAAIHAAAPCPVAVKQAMFDWWGPIVYEYYGGTETNGLTFIPPDDWLAHPGSVGRGHPRRHPHPRSGRQRAPRGHTGHHLLLQRDGVRVPQRSGEDGVRARREGPLDDRRHGLRRRRGVPLPHRPQGVHDHLRRREHLSAGGRERRW